MLAQRQRTSVAHDEVSTATAGVAQWAVGGAGQWRGGRDGGVAGRGVRAAGGVEPGCDAGWGGSEGRGAAMLLAVR